VLLLKLLWLCGLFLDNVSTQIISVVFVSIVSRFLVSELPRSRRVSRATPGDGRYDNDKQQSRRTLCDDAINKSCLMCTVNLFQAWTAVCRYRRAERAERMQSPAVKSSTSMPSTTCAVSLSQTDTMRRFTCALSRICWNTLRSTQLVPRSSSQRTAVTAAMAASTNTYTQGPSTTPCSRRCPASAYNCCPTRAH
jgi:hypothetical protein